MTKIKHSSRELAEALNRFAFDTELTENPEVLEVKVQSNRVSDASGHIGFSEEVARILKTKIARSKPVFKKSPISIEPKLAVTVADKKLCRRYLAAYCEDLKINVSPKWMQQRLAACGLRPINAVVDILNYVMLEYGQPLHAFDYDKLGKAKNQAQIIVRRGKVGEKITSLEDKSYKLIGTELLICDNQQPLALAGIKGGKAVEIHKNTKRIVIEAANFEPVAIRLTAKQLGLKTDASWRFENDLSPELAQVALERSCQLVQEICGGAVAKNFIDIYPGKERPRIVRVTKSEIEKILGVVVPLKEFERILGTFSEKVQKEKGGVYKLIVLPQRRDIRLREDVAEEVMRLYGCDKIPATQPLAAVRIPQFDVSAATAEFFQDNLVKLGFNETLNYSLISEAETKVFRFAPQVIVRVANPASELYSYLRPGLLVGLLRNLKLNLKFSAGMKIFEIGKVFSKRNHGNEYIPKEQMQLELVAAGLPACAGKPAQAGGKDGQQQFFELKGAVENLLAQCGLTQEDYEFKKEDLLPYAKGESASLILRSALSSQAGGKTQIGVLGNLDSRILSQYGIDCPVAHAELGFEFLPVKPRKFTPFSKYPFVTRDLSVFVPSATTIGEVENFIRSGASKLLVGLEVFDVFEKSGKSSLSFHLVFGSMVRTLTDTEVQVEMKKIISLLAKQSFEIR